MEILWKGWGRGCFGVGGWGVEEREWGVETGLGGYGDELWRKGVGGGEDLISVLYVALIFYLFLSRTSVHQS